MKLIVYALVDPRDQVVRYIGKSSKGLSRPKSHIKRIKFERGHKTNWLKSLVSLGLTCRIQVLAEATTKEELSDMERAWIAWARAEGWPLTNITDGGEGASGLQQSPEHKAKIGAANKGRARDPETKAKVSAGLRAWWAAHPEARKRTFSPEHLAALRAATQTEEFRAKNSAIVSGRKWSAEARERLSIQRRGIQKTEEQKAALRGPRVLTPEQRAAYSAAAKKANANRWAKPGAREALSERNKGNNYGALAKGRVVSEESRAKMSASQSARQERARAAVQSDDE